MACDVSRREQIRGVPEGEQASVPEQQIEGAGEESKAEHIHGEDRIDDEGRDQPGDDEDRVAQPLDPGRGLQRSLPKRPAGRTKRTIAMMMNTTVEASSG